MAEPRYAVYYAPPEDSPLARAGARWLGRDAISGEALAQPAFGGIAPERLRALTAEPRRYGLHATLKPPFLLRPERSLSELGQALIELAARQQAFDFELRIAPLGGFLAWQPVSAQARIEAVAAACVQALDGFRVPPAESELARRRAAGLSARQEALMARWGYPYVLEEFRFHLTLSGKVAGEEARILEAALRAGGAGLALQPLPFDSLCLFREAAPGEDFRLIARYGFDGRVQHYPGWPA